MKIGANQRLIANTRLDTKSGLNQVTQAITVAFGKPKRVVLDEDELSVVDYEYSWGLDLSTRKAINVLERLHKEDFEVLVEGDARGVTLIVKDHRIA